MYPVSPVLYGHTESLVQRPTPMLHCSRPLLINCHEHADIIFYTPACGAKMMAVWGTALWNRWWCRGTGWERLGGSTVAEKMKFCPLITVMSNPSDENSFQANTIVNTGPTMYNMAFINQYHFTAVCYVRIKPYWEQKCQLNYCTK